MRTEVAEGTGGGGVGMDLATAVARVIKEYEQAKKREYIYNPLAYALYKVWKDADNAPPRIGGKI